jgi:hypothetical protein
VHISKYIHNIGFGKIKKFRKCLFLKISEKLKPSFSKIFLKKSKIGWAFLQKK